MTAYFLACNQRRDYVVDLLSCLYRETDVFVINCDPKAPLELKSSLLGLSKKYSNIFVLPEIDYSWAGYSQVKATLNAVDTALQTKKYWSHFVTLSEQHLPTMSPDDLDALLSTRGSIMSARRVGDMAASEKLDIETRFALNYKELPGVGCFANGLNVDQPEIDDFYHGSNWFIMSRRHCEFLRRKRAEGFFRTFQFTVHSDENAIQTAIYSPQGLAEDSCDNSETTFVAWPHLTDNEHLIITEENFWCAVKEGMPFVRKRPEHIPTAVASRLDHQHKQSLEYQEHVSFKNNVRIKMLNLRLLFLEKTLRRIIKARFSSLIFESFPEMSQKPFFYLRLSLQNCRNLSVNILSDNLKDFKVLLAQEHDFETFFLPYVSGGYEVSLIRARVYAIFFKKELLAVDLYGRGFARVSGINVDKLLRVILFQINAMQKLAHSAPL